MSDKLSALEEFQAAIRNAEREVFDDPSQAVGVDQVIAGLAGDLRLALQEIGDLKQYIIGLRGSLDRQEYQGINVERAARVIAERNLLFCRQELDAALPVLEAARRLRNSALDPNSEKGAVLDAVKDVTVAIGEYDGTPPFAYDAARAAGEEKGP